MEEYWYYIYIYITRLASNEIFSPSNKIHREVGRAKDFAAPRVDVAVRNACSVSGGKSEGKIPPGGPTQRWKVNTQTIVMK